MCTHQSLAFSAGLARISLFQLSVVMRTNMAVEGNWQGTTQQSQLTFDCRYNRQYQHETTAGSFHFCISPLDVIVSPRFRPCSPQSSSVWNRKATIPPSHSLSILITTYQPSTSPSRTLPKLTQTPTRPPAISPRSIIYDPSASLSVTPCQPSLGAFFDCFFDQT